MSGVAQWTAGTAALWLVIAGLAVSEARTWLRSRRIDARAREAARTASPDDLAQWLPRETTPALARTSTREGQMSDDRDYIAEMGASQVTVVEWLRSPEGEQWSRDRALAGPGPTVPIQPCWRAKGPLPQRHDPCGRPPGIPFAGTGSEP